MENTDLPSGWFVLLPVLLFVVSKYIGTKYILKKNQDNISHLF